MPDNRIAPFDVGSNDANVRLFSGGVLATETTHSANAVPEHFKGRYVTLQAAGGSCWFFFSTNASAEVDRAVAATAAGASAKVGFQLLAGVPQDWEVPTAPPGTSMYFVRESDATGTTVTMALSDRRK